MGGKGKLLWLINKLAPSRYAKFVDVFGGSGTVTLNRPLRRGCIEIYNDFNSNLTNLFCCVKERTMACENRSSGPSRQRSFTACAKAMILRPVWRLKRSKGFAPAP